MLRGIAGLLFIIVLLLFMYSILANGFVRTIVYIFCIILIGLSIMYWITHGSTFAFDTVIIFMIIVTALRFVNRKHKSVKTEQVSGVITYEMFYKLAKRIAKPVRRLDVEVRDAKVYGTVQSQSGLNSWKFAIDFNDNGSITGYYHFIYCENDDSNISTRYANTLCAAIMYALENNNNSDS